MGFSQRVKHPLGKKNEISFSSMLFSNFRGTEYFVKESSPSDLWNIQMAKWWI